MKNETQEYAHAVTRGLISYVEHSLSMYRERDFSVDTIRDTPRVLNVVLTIDPQRFKDLRRIETELSMAMGMPEKYSINVTRGSGPRVRVEVPKPEGLTFPIFDSFLPQSALPFLMTVGVDLDMRPVRIDYTRPLQAHTLIAGQNGSGKTYLQRMLATSVARRSDPSDAQLCVVDVSKRGLHWQDFKDSAHLAHPIVVDEDEALRVVHYLANELDARAEAMAVPPAVPRTFLVIDELSDLVESDAGEVLQRDLVRIARLGREYGIHLVLSTQYPTVAQVGGNVIKRQLGVRFIGKMDDAVSARTATGLENSGAQHLTGPGDFLMVVEGSVRRFQAAMVEDATLPGSVEARTLDLTDLDIPHDVPKRPGRPKLPLDAGIVAQLMAKAVSIDDPEGVESMHTVGSWVKPRRINANRAERHWEFALQILNDLRSGGVSVCIESE